MPRTTLVKPPVARLRGMGRVRLLDLSLGGAQIEHPDLLRLGGPCDLELPPPFGACVLPSQVVWCTVAGRTKRPGGESRLLARSGLRFNGLTVAQRAALAWLLGNSGALDLQTGAA